MNKAEIKLHIKENRIVRFVAKPFATLKRRIDLTKYRKSEDAKYIRSLCNFHSGEDCFIIGNGPSLTARDLDMIAQKGIAAFGTNRIYNIFDRTQWRPKYYVSLDFAGLETEMSKICNGGDYCKLLNYKAAKFGRKEEDNIHYIFTFGTFKVNPYEMESKELSEDCSHHVSKTATVTANAIELAIYMGYKRIYLLGVDNNYARKRLSNGKVINDPTMKTSYFEGMKDFTGAPGDGFSVQTVDYMNEAYEVCKQFAKTHNVEIYNATRGGKLETFKRVDFDVIIQSIGSNT